MPGRERSEPPGRSSSGPPSHARSAGVLDRLRTRADASGFVPFDRFMEVALYSDPGGFYAAPESPFGAEGSYYTAAHVSSLFGATLLAHLLDVRRAVGLDRPFRVVELGPGDGTLARTMLESMAGDPAWAGSELCLVDRSAPLRARALARAEPAARTAGVAIRTAEFVGDGGPFEGAVVANEVFDALPARRLRWTGALWNELGVRVEGDRVVAAEAEGADPLPRDLPTTGTSPGSIYEFSPAADGVVREAADHLVAGSFVILDFGMEEGELLSAHPAGTLEGLRGHRGRLDPLSAPGATDLSVFVNFSRLRAAARRAGLAVVHEARQADTLGAWGFAERLAEAVHRAGSAEAEVRLRLAAKNLLFGFERFRVLELAPSATADAARRLTSRG